MFSLAFFVVVFPGVPVNRQLAAKQLVAYYFFNKKAPKVGKKH